MSLYYTSCSRILYFVHQVWNSWSARQPLECIAHGTQGLRELIRCMRGGLGFRVAGVLGFQRACPKQGLKWECLRTTPTYTTLNGHLLQCLATALSICIYAHTNFTRRHSPQGINIRSSDIPSSYDGIFRPWIPLLLLHGQHMCMSELCKPSTVTPQL